MDSRTKVCIVNAHTGDGWYPMGQKRLERSLIYHGYAHDLYFVDYWPNHKYDKSCPYNIKAAAMEEASKMGYDILVWMDCSMWVIKDIYPLLDIVVSEGYYFWNNPDHNCSNICTDASLEYFGITRDEAEGMGVVNSGFWGVHLHGSVGQTVLKRFIEAGKNGAFKGTRSHDNQSMDPRFWYHRADQSALSVIVAKMGLKTHGYTEHIMYYQPEMPDNIIVTLKGL